MLSPDPRRTCSRTRAHKRAQAYPPTPPPPLPPPHPQPPPPQIKVVVLSPDAEAPLSDGPLDPGRAYIIGGIVDRSVQKGITLGFAVGGAPVPRLAWGL